MKSYLIQYRNGEPTLKFNGYIYEEKEDNFYEPTLVLGKLPEHFREDDMVYIDEYENVHFIDSRPIDEYEAKIKSIIYDKNGKIRKMSEFSDQELKDFLKYKMCLDAYFLEPILLKGKEEEEFIAYKEAKRRDLLQQI